MSVTISKWGNSYGVRIPIRLAHDLGLEPGVEVEVSKDGDSLRVTPLRRTEVPEYSLRTLLSGVTEDKLHGEMPTGGALGREVIE